jgi:hypothetical protein
MAIENYCYELVQQNDDTFTWNVIETQTGQTIAEYLFEDDAISMVMHLMSGGGFDGFTPRFFVT